MFELKEKLTIVSIIPNFRPLFNFFFRTTL